MLLQGGGVPLKPSNHLREELQRQVTLVLRQLRADGHDKLGTVQRDAKVVRGFQASVYSQLEGVLCSGEKLVGCGPQC